jgi:hypothetical protein
VAIVQRDDHLEQAIEAADLPALILEKFPDAGGHRGTFQQATRATLCAVWRGEKSPSVSLTLKSGRWLWHDHGTHEGGNAFQFLVRVCGFTPGQAAQELLERAGLTNTARTGSRPAESERDRLEREFRREHPNADQDFCDNWLEIRATGWREFGTPVGRAAMEYAATTPSLPDLPGALLAYKMLGQPVPLEGQPFGAGNLKLLADWIAECLRPAFNREVATTRPNPSNAWGQTSSGWGSQSSSFLAKPAFLANGMARNQSPSSTRKSDFSPTKHTEPGRWK